MDNKPEGVESCQSDVDQRLTSSRQQVFHPPHSYTVLLLHPTCSERVRSIQRYHMNTKKWADIGYSFLVGNDGNVYERRGWSRVGAHTYGFNNDLAASFIGNFNNELQTSAALNAAKNLIQCGVDKGYIKSSYTLHGHRDVSSTTCTGNKLYAEIKKWPHYQSMP